MKQEFFAAETAVLEMFAHGGMSKEALIAYIAIVCENAGGPGAFDVLEAAGIDAVSAGRVFDELAALKIVHGNTLRRVRRTAAGSEKTPRAKKDDSLAARGEVEMLIIERERAALAKLARKNGRFYRRGQKLSGDARVVSELRAQIARLGDEARDAVIRFYDNGGYGVPELVNYLKSLTTASAAVFEV